MCHQLQKKNCLLLIVLCPFILQAQLNAGAYFSTFYLPGVSFRTNGLGIMGQYEADKTTVYELSAGYFSKKGPIDSFSYVKPDASTGFIQFHDDLSFLHFSADFVKYLAGSTSRKTKVSFYMGAGLSVLRRQTKTVAQTIPEQSEKTSFTTFGFEYLIGVEAKFGFARVFIRGKANIFLKYPVAMDDGTVLPLLTNAQGGVLFPLLKYKKPHGRVVM